MKHLSFLVSIMVTLYTLPGIAVAQNENNETSFSLLVARSGCCKARRTIEHPWARTSMSYEQCEAANANDPDGDNIYQSTGLTWWDRSC
jgi:hypothetical protein